MDPNCAVCIDEHVDANGTFGSTHKIWNGEVLGNGEVCGGKRGGATREHEARISHIAVDPRLYFLTSGLNGTVNAQRCQNTL